MPAAFPIGIRIQPALPPPGPLGMRIALIFRIMCAFFKTSENNLKIAIVTGMSLVSFTVYGLYCFSTVKQVQINGPQYQRIAETNALLADVMPPRGFLLEAYLNASEMLDAKGEMLSELGTKAASLKKEYLDGNEGWNGALADDTLKSLLNGKATLSGLEMLRILDDEFIPALEKGDRAKAEALLRGPIARQFQEHREGVDALTRMALLRKRQNEARAAQLTYDRTLGQIVLGLFLVFLQAVVSLVLIRKYEAKLRKVVIGMVIGSVPVSRDIREKIMWN
jgi:methyl-accepting chemotaxis protein